MPLGRLLRALSALPARLTGHRGAALPLSELHFVAIDIETTGLDPRTDLPVALAAIPFRGGRPDVATGYSGLVNPGRSIPSAARAIHGIGDEHVREAPPVAAALPGFLAACRAEAIVAHTARFDVTIVNRVARSAGLPPLEGAILDIGILAHGLFPSWWDLTLEGLARLTEGSLIARHTAKGDALSAGFIFLKMIPALERRKIRTLSAALRLQRSVALLPGGPGATGGGLAGP
ncbi:MAG TPA: 3'-5' exonuclease [Methylomirabilota bacterium]|jgi:DNA polymerase-3 subunit epsilon